MQQWEYMQYHLPTSDEMDKFGIAGWELVAVSNYMFYFKRPKK